MKECSNGNGSFSSLDYMAETPEWAVFGDNHRGFDPNETRWFRKIRTTIFLDAREITDMLFLFKEKQPPALTS